MSDVRASDAERDDTVERLRTAGGEGRLTLEELADRIEVAAHARTRRELAALTADLPAAPPMPLPAGSVDAGISTLGDIKRSGSWILPEESRWRTIFGSIVLDLRAAQLAAPVVTLEVRAVFGQIDVLVPEGVAVDMRARSRLGQLSHETNRQPPAPGAPVVVITGSNFFGGVRVRHQRLWEKLADRLIGRAR